MNSNYELYKGSQQMEKLYHGSDKIYYVYKGEDVIWEDRAYAKGQTIYESETAGKRDIYFDSGIYDVILVGGCGQAAMRGIYDDRGYGSGGGSGGAFVGRVKMPQGTYTVTVGKANNNPTPQAGNSQNLPPTDTTIYNTSIGNLIIAGGGGSASAYNSVGAAGATPIIDASVTVVKTTLSKAGNAGHYNSGGKGSDAPAYCAGGASVYNNYGTGQGCRTSEYANNRSWVAGSGGYIKIVYVEDSE